MSHDVVHVAKVSKIQRSSDAMKGSPGGGIGDAASNNRRSCKESTIGGGGGGGTGRYNIDGADFHGNISPRCGTMQSSLGGGEMDSPDHTQRDTTESDNNISSCSTLDIVNKVDNLTVQHLESQVRELSQRLQQSESDRNEMQKQLDKSNMEKEQCYRRLEIVSAAHECRITEMHCVIAELSKKLRTKQENVIEEEQENDCSEVSYQEGSVYNSELNLTNPDAECQTDPIEGSHCDDEGVDYEGSYHRDNLAVDIMMEDMKLNDSSNRAQVEALQEEVLHLKAQIALLQSEIANSHEVEDPKPTTEQCHTVECYAEEDVEANDSNCSLEQMQYDNRMEDTQALASPHRVKPLSKVAERVKLHCVSKNSMEKNKTRNEHDQQQSEFKDSINEKDAISNSRLLEEKALLDSYFKSATPEGDLQRLQRQTEQLEMQNTVLALTLNECKEHCEHLYLLCGKYESNAIALQLAVNCSDRAIEAYDVMLALLESKMVLMNEKSSSAEESRKAVETVARHLLERFENEKNLCENSLGPWQNSFSIPDKISNPWTVEDDNRLRHHVSKLKGRRAIIQNTIVNLESPFSDFYEKARLACMESNKEIGECLEKAVLPLDLDTAVLMQELLNLRDENASLKSKVEEADKERISVEERMGILHTAVQELQLQLLLKQDPNAGVLFNKDDGSKENRASYSEAEHAALTEQQLVEALTRESELKGRIQTLIASVTQSQKLSNEKYEQLNSNVKELQKSNLNLSQMLEQSKRKYQARIKKLEHKVMEMNSEMMRPMGGTATAAGGSALQHDNVPETTL